MVRFSKVLVTFRSRKAVQRFKRFENDTIKLSVSETKLAGLGATNYASIQLVSTLNFALGAEK